MPKAMDSKMALRNTSGLVSGPMPMNPAVALGSLIGACSPLNPGTKKTLVSGA